MRNRRADYKNGKFFGILAAGFAISAIVFGMVMFFGGILGLAIILPYFVCSTTGGPLCDIL